MSILPIALAEEDTSSENTEIVDSEDLVEDVVEESENVNKVNSENMRKRARLRADKFKMNLLKVNKGVIKERKNFLELREKHRKHKAKLLNLKKSAKKCEGEDCVKKKFELKRGFKNHLINGLNVIEKSLDRIKNRVENSEKIDGDQKEDFLSLINDLFEKVVSQNEVVESLNEESTSEEHRAALKDTKSLWKEVKKTQKRIVGFLVNSKLDKLVAKHEEFSNGMQMRIDNLDEKGADVDELNDLKENFEEHVKELNENYEIAKDAWKNVQSGTESMEVWHKAQKQVREDLRDTKKLLREFISEYREVKSSLEDSEN